MANDNTTPSRRLVLAGMAASGAAGAAPARAQGADWPNRPVRIIVPYPAGGSTDVLTRILAERLKDKLGQSWVIDNRPGAGGNVGIDAVAKSDADGYTIGSATVGNFSINRFLYSRISYDSDRDLQAVSMTWDMPNVAVIPTEHVPAKTLAEFVAWAKARPGGIFYGSPGVGTSPHLSGALFCVRNGITGTHVPFRGAAATIPAMLKGDIQFALDNLASYTSIIESGQMRALAVTSESRWPTLQAIPTMAEAGTPDFVVTSWAAFVLPKATPRPIVDRLSRTIREVSRDRSLMERFQTAGARPLAPQVDA